MRPSQPASAMNRSRRLRFSGWQLTVIGLICFFVGAEMRSTFGQSNSLFQPGDRVAWIGGQIFESAQEQGWLEAELRWRLLLQSPSLQDISFRNVAWSGDDVEGRARAVFGGLEDGYQRRLVDLRAAQPTLVILGYGTSEAMDDRWNEERFTKSMTRLLDDLKQQSMRVVLLVPPLLSPKSPMPGNRLGEINRRLPIFQQAIQKIAQARELQTIPLPVIQPEWTDDGIHLNDSGARAWAQSLAQSLCPTESSPGVAGKDAIHVNLQQAEAWEEQGWQLRRIHREKPWSWVEVYRDLGCAPPARVQFAGLPSTGRFQLTIDGQVVATGTADEWSRGIDVRDKGIDRQYDQLRNTIIERDTAFFHRYRPQNETYLFLFRKHEQGNNAPEVERFDAIAKELDNRIRSLSIPKSAKWELKPE